MNRCFRETLSIYQREVEEELRRFFKKKINQSDKPFKREVLGILEEFSLRPAKRIRPILVNWGYFLAGGTDKKAILEVSIFIELLHNMALIHDDIIDQDQFRRGGKTIHHLYGNGHYGQSMALVVGDVLVFLGYEILNSSDFPSENKLLAAERLSWILAETAYGQILEMQIKERANLDRETEEDVLEVYRLKTALYSFVCPLQIGALLAGAKEDFLEKIERFALLLGIAFQIQDDIRDKDSIREDQKELVLRYIGQSKEILISEKTFPQEAKQFLLGLADCILKGEY